MLNNNYLQSSSNNYDGSYRAMLLYDGIEARIFIPGMYCSQIKESDLERMKKCFPIAIFASVQMRETALIGQSSCYVVFENGDLQRPIVTGYFGKGIRSIGISSETSSDDIMYSNSDGSFIQIDGYGDVLLVAGHGNGDPGAGGNGYNEADLTREIVRLISTKMNCDVFDTSKNMYADLKGTNATNYLKKYKVVMEIHFNASSGASGTELLVSNTSNPTIIESKVLLALVNVGFKNRGFKDGNWLGNMNKCKLAGVSNYFLVEVCFIDSSSDMSIYKSNKDKIATNIANAFKEVIESTKEIKNIGTGSGKVDNNTTILGSQIATTNQMKAFLKSKNPNAKDYVNIYVVEGRAEGVRADIAFAQSCLETGFWKFGGDVKESQNNFSGLGAIGGGNPGYSFASSTLGIRAQMQHLRFYAGYDPVQTNVTGNRNDDAPQTKGTVTTLGKLQQSGWAASGYGYSLVSMINEMLTFPK